MKMETHEDGDQIRVQPYRSPEMEMDGDVNCGDQEASEAYVHILYMTKEGESKLPRRLEWTVILGKLHDTRSLSSSVVCATDFMKMATGSEVQVEGARRALVEKRLKEVGDGDRMGPTHALQPLGRHPPRGT